MCARFNVGLLLFFIFALAACNSQRGQTLEQIPTPAQINRLATAQYLTQNAPPPDYRGPAAIPEVDAGLSDLPGARYIVHLEFNGVFANTPRQTNASANAEVWLRQIGSARRVIVSTSGELLGKENNAFEAVRLGPDAFMVRQNTCLAKASDAEVAADLRAGTLVGGVKRAVPTGRRATINNEDSWEYSFIAGDLNLPSIRFAEGGSLNASSGELWIAPKHHAVVRLYVNLDVTNAIIFDRQLPVTGQVILRYDLYDVGIAPNITVPYGC
jgi:hypothetical protein